jgi:type IV secretion system protein VirD4
MPALPLFAALAAIPLASAFASWLFLTIKGWWASPYYAHGMHWAWAWWVYVADPGPSLMTKAWLALTGLGGLAMGIALVRFSWPDRNAGFYGRAKWQTMWGAIRAGLTFSLRPKPDGILLGKHLFAGFIWLYVSLRGDLHVSLTATTGSGKGVSFVNPNVLNWAGPVFCFSVKRDVLNACAAERERKGDKVFIFDVTEPDGVTHQWSGFGEVRRYTPDIYSDIQKIMHTIIPETKANNPYWDNAARKIATAVMVMLAEIRDHPLNIEELLGLIGAHNYDVLLRDMIYTSRLKKRPFPRRAVDAVLEWLDNKAVEGAAAVRENITTALALWNDPRVCAATNSQEFELKTLRSQRVSVFVCAQPGDIRLLRPVYGLLFNQLIQMNSRVEFSKDPTHRKHRTLIMLDERWALGGMRELDDAFAYLRSYGFRFCVVLQSKGQLKTSLGEEGADNLFNNIKCEMIFGGTDQKTADEVSKRAGINTEVESSRSRPRFSLFNFSRHTESESKKGRPLLLPQEVAQLDEKFVVVQMKGKPPLKLHRIFWYEDRHFRDMVGEPSGLPKLEVTMKRDEESALNAEDMQEV